MRKRKTKTFVNCQSRTSHRFIPEPPDKSIGAGLIFLVASFFNNTRSFQIESRNRDSAFRLNYKSFGYDEEDERKIRRR